MQTNVTELNSEYSQFSRGEVVSENVAQKTADSSFVMKEIGPSTAHTHELEPKGDRFVIHADLPGNIAISVFTKDDRLVLRKAMSRQDWISPFASHLKYKIMVHNQSVSAVVAYKIMTLAQHLSTAHPEMQGCAATN